MLDGKWMIIMKRQKKNKEICQLLVLKMPKIMHE